MHPAPLPQDMLVSGLPFARDAAGNYRPPLQWVTLAVRLGVFAAGTGLALGAYEVKLNHRRLLDAMLAIAGVPPQKFRPICSAIDKLDKEPWEAVRAGARLLPHHTNPKQIGCCGCWVLRLAGQGAVGGGAGRCACCQTLLHVLRRKP